MEERKKGYIYQISYLSFLFPFYSLLFFPSISSYSFPPPSSEVCDEGLVTLAAACANLTYLGLSHCGVGDVGVAAVGAHCASVSHLYLSHTHVADAGVAAIARGCKKLKHLDLGNTQEGG